MNTALPNSSGVHQRGYSLISMMVGLVISLLTIAAMLSVYTMMIEVSGKATADSQRDGQVASGLLSTQMELHSAGYGTGVSGVDGNVVVNNDGRHVSWRYVVDGVGVCARLSVVPDGEGGAEMRLARNNGCGAIPSTWSGDEVVLVSYGQPWKNRDGTLVDDAASGFYLAEAKFKLASTAADGLCSLPYAQQKDAEAVSPRISLESGGRELFSMCLSNIVVS